MTLVIGSAHAPSCLMVAADTVQGLARCVPSGSKFECSLCSHCWTAFAVADIVVADIVVADIVAVDIVVADMIVVDMVVVADMPGVGTDTALAAEVGCDLDSEADIVPTVGAAASTVADAAAAAAAAAAGNFLDNFAAFHPVRFVLRTNFRLPPSADSGAILCFLHDSDSFPKTKDSPVLDMHNCLKLDHCCNFETAVAAGKSCHNSH